MKMTGNQVFLPINLEIKIAENDPVIKLVEICEELDYSRLEKEYVRKWRKLDPATMFMILVYGYMRHLYSSREIEEACRTDIRFMWILGPADAPDHSTIARFQNDRLVPVIEDLFYQLIEKLIELNEISYSNVFVDGTKIEANANKYSFVWSKAVEKNSRKLEDKILRIVPEIAKRYSLNEEISLTQCLQILMQTAAMQKIQFVHGRGKHKTQLQRDIDLLIELGDKRQAYRESMSKFGKRKSYSKTDNDKTLSSSRQIMR